MFKVRIKKSRKNRRIIVKSEIKLHIFLFNYEKKKKIIKLSNEIKKKILFKITFNHDSIL